MEDKIQLKPETRTAFRGLTATARIAGCSREHLSRVLHGRLKPGKKLARKLARMGVAVPGMEGTP